MNQSTTLMRRGMWVAVCLVAMGLSGCKIGSSDSDTPAQEDVEFVPAADDFRPAFVLATDDAPVLSSSFRQTMSLQSSAYAVIAMMPFWPRLVLLASGPVKSSVHSWCAG